MKKNGLVLSLTKGYTLLELLVVIGLITILMSFGAASYSTAQKKARDSRRRTDLKSLQSAMEQYYSICSFKYKVVATNGDPITEVKTPAGTTCTVPNSTILSGIKDPLGGVYYYECFGCDGSKYKICPSSDVPGGKKLETVDCSDDSCCVSNQQ